MKHTLFPLMTVAALSAVAVAHAATDSRLQPKTVEPPVAEKAAPPQTTPAEVQDQVPENAPLLRHLYMTAMDAEAPATAEEGLTITGLPELETDLFKQEMAAYLGQPLTMAQIQKLTHDVVQYYQENDGTLVDVIAPAGQDITDGALHLKIVRARLGHLTTQGNKYFAGQKITDAFTTEEGNTINHTTMMKDLDWVNRNPFRRVNLLYRRGENLGETDAVLMVADRKPYRVYAGADNTGNKLTGNTRLYAGFNLGNACCLDHQLNYQFTASDDFEKMQAHAASYVVPLPWRHLLEVSTSYQRVRPDVAAPLSSKGFSFDAAVDYTIPVRASTNGNEDLVLGYEFKRSNNNIEFGGTQVFNNTIDVSQFSVGYNGKYDDPYGNTSFGATLVASPGGLTDKNSDTAFTVARSASTADYTYVEAELQRSTKLPMDLVLVNELNLQLSPDRLPGLEQLSAGGTYSVRGYSEGVVSGDSGFTLRNELRLPVQHVLTDQGMQDALVPLLFADLGVVRINDPQSGEERRHTLLSVGPGLSYQLNDMLSARLAYGVQLQNSDATATSKTGQRAHFGLTMYY